VPRDFLSDSRIGNANVVEINPAVSVLFLSPHDRVVDEPPFGRSDIFSPSSLLELCYILVLPIVAISLSSAPVVIIGKRVTLTKHWSYEDASSQLERRHTSCPEISKVPSGGPDRLPNVRPYSLRVLVAKIS
jgi:hypothetical protein